MNEKSARFDRVLIIGLGLIGGSLASALRGSQFCRTVVGYNRTPSSLSLAVELGVIDEIASDLPQSIAQADIIVIGVPALSLEPTLQLIKENARPETILTDVISVKGSVVEAARNVYGAVPTRLVPGHPIAGSEKSGVTAANSRLFQDHKVILTPLPTTASDALQAIIEMWQLVGADVVAMEVTKHDKILAATSHLPHLLAYSLVDALAGQDESNEIFQFAAGGFRDFTRIASSDAVMWHDIVLANKKPIVEAMDVFSEHFAELRRFIEQDDSNAIMELFLRARSTRERFMRLQKRKGSESQVSKTAAPESGHNNHYGQVDYYSAAGKALHGRVRVPGDKSISHRSIMLGSLADGTTQITGFLEGEDSLATLQAFRTMGVAIEGPEQGRVTIHGVGMDGLKAPAEPLYLGNSGTSMRLLAGLLAGQSFSVRLTGDKSLSQRPMERVATPLRAMGAIITMESGGCPPVCLQGGAALHGIDYELPMASAQVKSCVLLAGLYACGQTTVTEKVPTRDHTERMLQGFGYPVRVQGNKISVTGKGRLSATRIDVPADISSAAFFLVAASIVPGSDLLLEHVGVNPTRTGVINILKAMGADIELINERESGGEPVADIRVKYAPLRGIEIPKAQVSLAIDEFPALFIAAAAAQGTTTLTGAEELRVKESDRIQGMVDGLRVLGIDAQALPDGAVIHGGKLQGGEVDSLGDHRLAMSFAVAGMLSESGITIRDCANVATSFPGFIALARQAGMAVRQLSEQS